MGAIRERFEKLTRIGRGEFDSDIKARKDGNMLDRDDVLALADELDRERAAQTNELASAYLSTRGTGTTAAEWARLYDAIHAMIDNQQRKDATE